ncbi:hypothetical protein GGR57DRAFT_6490 [Xylariaceae sp. FL1272]|nr:hypothetical protein GGR57DRAFT_6490 [Xylariaceae sp. FL1272]
MARQSPFQRRNCSFLREAVCQCAISCKGLSLRLSLDGLDSVSFLLGTVLLLVLWTTHRAMLESFDGQEQPTRGRGSIQPNRSMPNLLEPKEATIQHGHEYPNSDKAPTLPGYTTARLQRRNTPVIPTTEASRAEKMLPAVHDPVSKPFVISPWPKSNKRATSNERRMNGASSRSFQYGITVARHEADAQSDATEVEYRHEVHMMEKRRRSEFPRRLGTAIVGGVFVIVPMIIMSVGRSLTKSLVTSSIAVFLFGITLACLKGSMADMLFGGGRVRQTMLACSLPLQGMLRFWPCS